MSETLKISGKKITIQDPTQKWSFIHRPGGWVIAQSEGGIRKRFMMNEVRGRMSAHLNGVPFFGEWLRKERQVGAQTGESDLVAQFPGKVRKILVSAGSEVTEDQPLILVEAMKMEFSVRAPHAGKVIQILVKEGQQLSPGDRFLDLETQKSG